MRVYVGGPMRGYPLYNFPAFFEAEARLKEFGHDVINPARLDVERGFDPATSEFNDAAMFGAMRRDITAILACDAMALLPGWEKSKGVETELMVAQAIGLEVWVIDPPV